MSEDSHERVIEVVRAKIDDIQKQIASAEALLKKLRKDGTATKIEQTEQLIFDLMVVCADLETSLKKLEPKTDEYGEITNIVDLITFLSKPEVRKAEGRRLYLAQRCATLEKERLSQVIRYDDGTYDAPMLLPENIRRDSLNGEKDQTSEEI